MNKIAATEVNDGLVNLTANLGTTRDKAAGSTYEEGTQLQDSELEAAYRTSWLARKVVTIPAMDSFRAWRDWQADEKQIEAIEAEELRLGLKYKLPKAATLARLYGECYLYFDVADVKNFMEPIKPERVKKGGIRFVTLFTHRQLVIGETDLDPMSETYGQPLYYQVSSPTQGFVKIHPSRVIRFIGNERPMDASFIGVRSDSVLCSLLTSVKHFDGTEANIASLVYEAKIDVISVKGLMQIAGNPRDEAKLLERYRLAATTKSTNGLLLLDADMETYEQKAVAFNTLPDIMDRMGQNVSGGADIPITRLFGKSPGGMNATGDSDMKNYHDSISALQELQYRPAMAIFDECLIQSALGARPDSVHYVWAPLQQTSEQERADLGTKIVATVKTLKDTGLLPDEVLASGVVSMLTEASVMPGLQDQLDKYLAEGGDMPHDLPPEGEDTLSGTDPNQPPGDQPGKPKPKAPVVKDEAPGQMRAPKGSPNGGQWIKGGSSAGGGVMAALNSVASAKYSTDKIAELTQKDPKELTHYEKKVLGKYKKALKEQEQLAANEKVFSNDKLASDAIVSTKKALAGEMSADEAMAAVKKAQVAGAISNGHFKEAQSKLLGVKAAEAEAKATAKPMTAEQKFAAIDTKHEAAKQAVNKADSEAFKAYQEYMAAPGGSADEKTAKEKYDAADSKAKAAHVALKDVTQEKNAAAHEQLAAQKAAEGKAELDAIGAMPTFGTPPAPVAKAPLGEFDPKKLAADTIATKQYPADKVLALLDKNPAELTHYEKKKLVALKKELKSEVAVATAIKGVSASQAAVKPTETAAVKIDPNSAAAASKFASLASSNSPAMQADTVKKLATGEWQPDPKKPYQATVAAKAKAYLSGVKEPAVPAGKSKYTDSSVQHKALSNPPPVSSLNQPQTAFAKATLPIGVSEANAITTYTGGSYQSINSSLRKGNPPTAADKLRDAAIAKHKAVTETVLLRGLASDAAAGMLGPHGVTNFVPGQVLKDAGYISTTRKLDTARNFGGSQGYVMKITVAAGKTVMPAKSISHHAQEDEFLLPRGSQFIVSHVDEDARVLHVTLA